MEPFLADVGHLLRNLSNLAQYDSTKRSAGSRGEIELFLSRRNSITTGERISVYIVAAKVASKTMFERFKGCSTDSEWPFSKRPVLT